MSAKASALRLSWFTVGYNVAEAVLSLLFGSAAGSIALIGFGLDSIVESLSGLVMVWRLRGHEGLSEAEEEALERRAERFVAATFLILAAYVLFESAEKLISRDIPDPSLPGIAIAAASLVVMPWLARRKRRVAAQIGSRALAADAKETMFCAALSVALLLGLSANYLFGLWQADPVCGLVIVGFLVKEGVEGLKGEEEEGE
jgi:divalent metal cation (Fe/Co/Zn/Cd) transporter